MTKIEDEIKQIKEELENKQADFEKKAKEDISRGFTTIKILLSIIALIMAFVGYFCYRGFDKANDANTSAVVLTERFNEHERQQKLWENSIIKKEQYFLSTKLMFLNIQDLKAILAGDRSEALRIEYEIKQLESKLLFQEMDNVTRGAK